MQDPTQSSLEAMLQETARVRVWDEGICGGEPLGELVREITDPVEITRLFSALRIFDGPAGHCLCYGDVALEMLAADNHRLALLAVQHGALLRCSNWTEDGELEDPMPLLTWLANLGITAPLAEYLEENENGEEDLPDH